MTLIARAARLKSCGLPRLILVTEDAPIGRIEAALRRLPRGAALILRHYDAPDREAIALRLRRLTRARGLVFSVAGDVRLALRVRADGFHAPEGLAQRAKAFRQHRPRAFVTVAAHGVPGLIAARRVGASAALLSPVFATPSHKGVAPLGVIRFAILRPARPFRSALLAASAPTRAAASPGPHSPVMPQSPL